MAAQSQDVNPDISNQCIANSSKNIVKQKPTETFDECWLHHMKSDIAETECSRIGEMDMGKWMMFVKKSELDQMWENCCDLYDAGKLTGITGMKCSTNYENPRSSDNTFGVIIIYCGPASDKLKMLEYGTNLLKCIPYYNKFGYIYYKSDIQTLGGTRKTGQTKNWLYRIPVPKTQDGPNSLT
ncbi:hypothetical protein ACI65C_008053 [Semiaphis heraclei]